MSLADSDGNMMLELYHNPPDAVPNYVSMDPLILHVAFMVDDVDAIRSKLMAAGATAVEVGTATFADPNLADPDTNRRHRLPVLGLWNPIFPLKEKGGS